MTEVKPYMSRSEVAWAISVSETTVDEMVRRGVLPKPIRLSTGCIRWRWETVDNALASLGETGNDSRPLPSEAEAVARAIKAAKDRGRGRAA